MKQPIMVQTIHRILKVRHTNNINHSPAHPYKILLYTTIKGIEKPNTPCIILTETTTTKEYRLPLTTFKITTEDNNTYTCYKNNIQHFINGHQLEIYHDELNHIQANTLIKYLNNNYPFTNNS